VRVWHSGRMSDVSSGGAEPAAKATGEALAARLLATHRALARLNVASDVRLRLNLRFMAICTSLKLPGANPASCASRLDRLMTDIARTEGSRGKEA
jgi:hypothetical protein